MQPDPLIGHSVPLLKELHILTRDGKLNQDSRRKLKQVKHLYQFIEPILHELQANGKELSVADHGAGKSYLGFILYDLFFRSCDAGHVYGIEARGDLVERSRELARTLNFPRMTFLQGSIAQSVEVAELPDQVSLVTALHACDTATDDAIQFGLQKKASFMVIVPCCQAEVARMLNRQKALSLAKGHLAELWRRPLHTREIGSQISNVLRCLYLEASGYEVTVTELVGWEHSLKNELIIAKKVSRSSSSAASRLKAILAEFGLTELLETRYRLA